MLTWKVFSSVNVIFLTVCSHAILLVPRATEMAHDLKSVGFGGLCTLTIVLVRLQLVLCRSS
jgi:hypothetical protein